MAGNRANSDGTGAGNGTALIEQLRNDRPEGVPSPIARKPKLDKISRLDAASSMIEAGEHAALEWVDWFNHRRLLEPIGNIPPAEAEANFYLATATLNMAA